jgi:hypothetical protein
MDDFKIIAFPVNSQGEMMFHIINNVTNEIGIAAVFLVMVPYANSFAKKYGDIIVKLPMAEISLN